MAGDRPESESKETEIEREDCAFVWDETTQLYFHKGSGFYHDPVAGWYYSSRDGLYYKFENGSYVRLEFALVEEYDFVETTSTGLGNSVDDVESCEHVFCDREENFSSLPIDESDACQCLGTGSDDNIPVSFIVSSTGQIEPKGDQEPDFPPPTSEWLEETLINRFLSGHRLKAAGDSVESLEMNARDDNQERVELCNIEEEASRDEENWRAQYGQVVYLGEEVVPDSHAVGLWDWAMVTGSKRNANDQEVRLVGRLVKRSAKLHPSMPSSGGLFRTAPICEVYLDLVRVRTGQVYKLHSPSTKYLASSSVYDSSNPTKDWGFPKFSVGMGGSNQKSEPQTANGGTSIKDLSELPKQISGSKKLISYPYRDRAAERRTLHSSYGLGPGQKSSAVDDATCSSIPIPSEEAAADAMKMSFGAGSYARKILESMGWKEGEALGSTTKGLVEPLQVVGNTGNAGLGWPQRTRNTQ